MFFKLLSFERDLFSRANGVLKEVYFKSKRGKKGSLFASIISKFERNLLNESFFQFESVFVVSVDFIRIALEAVPNTTDCINPLEVWPKLTSKSCDMDINVPIYNKGVVIMDIIKELISCKDLASV